MSSVTARSAVEIIHDEMTRRIVSGSLPGGTRITEPDLCDEFQVTFVPARRAIRWLELDGLVDRAPTFSCVVHEMTRSDIADIAELHGAFDRLAVRQAAARRSDEDISRFRADVQRAHDAYDAKDFTDLADAGIAFRTHTYEATGNPVLIEVHQALLSRTLRMFRLSDPAVYGPLPRFDQLEAAFIAGDPDGAEHAMDDLSARLQAARHSHVRAELQEAINNEVAFDEEPTVRARQAEGTYVPEYLQVLDRLRQQIIRGERQPGSVLSERRIAAEMGVSRFPAQEAIHMLHREGLATIGAPRVPSTVRGLPPGEAEDLFDVASALDVLAARLAAQRHRRDDLAVLKRRLVEEQQTPPDQVSELVDRMFAFRAQILRMSGNDLLVEVNSLLESRMRILVTAAPLSQVVLHGHRVLYEAIADRDMNLAEVVYNDVFTRADRRGQILESAPR